MRPLIGITTYYLTAAELEQDDKRLRGMPGDDATMAVDSYARAVEMAGGLPVHLPAFEDSVYLREVAERMDGFIFSGGPDIHPERYGQEIRPWIGRISPKRDAFEFALIDAVLEAKKPVLGICRGCQLLNVVLGGTLFQDIQGEGVTGRNHSQGRMPGSDPFHWVRLKNGRLLDIAGEEEIPVNSFHHQAVDRLARPLLAVARSEDGLIEAFEHQDYSFFMGIQWHPERMASTDRRQLAIFRAFVDACGSKL